jgi:predicted nucleic acid-binding protein
VAEVIEAGGLQEIKVTDPVEVSAFATLQGTGRIGVGECSAIAVVANRGLPIALDDKRARKEARRFEHSIAVVNTEAIMVSLIEEKVLDVAAADAIKQDWEQNHRFKLPFLSFRERV